jgi:hypothetical protein
MKITQKSRIEFLKSGISTKVHWARRALIIVYNNQTASEQNNGHTIENNGVGFSGADSEFLSSLAEQLITKKSISAKQDQMVMKLMPKYTKQVLAQTDLELLDSLIAKEIETKIQVA